MKKKKFGNHAVIANEVSMNEWMVQHGCKHEDYLMVISDLNDLSNGACIGHVYMEIKGYKIYFDCVNTLYCDCGRLIYVYEFKGESK